MDNKYDVVIIGAGPAGLTSGIYASRAGLRTIIFERAITGGQITMTEKVENYPGFENEIGGLELSEKMRLQCEKFGAVIKDIEVVKIHSLFEPVKLIETKNGNYYASAVIIATGAVAKKLDVPGEIEFTGRGVSYCAVCDAAFFRNKEVVVVGGGDTAVEEALFLTKFCNKVTIVHRRDRLRASDVIQKRAVENSKIDVKLNSVMKAVEGEKKVSGVLLEDVNTKAVTKFNCDGVFVFVGYTPNSKFLDGDLKMDKYGYIITDNEMRTDKEGVFACGDVRSKNLRQVVVSCGEGAVAAYSAQLYVEKLKGQEYPR